MHHFTADKNISKKTYRFAACVCHGVFAPPVDWFWAVVGIGTWFVAGSLWSGIMWWRLVLFGVVVVMSFVVFVCSR